MFVISLSLDQAAINEQSGAFIKLQKYAQLTQGLFVLVPAKKKLSVIKNSLAVFGIPSHFGFGYILSCLKTTNKIVKEYALTPKNTVIDCQDPFLTGFSGLMIKFFYHFPIVVENHGNFFATNAWVRESPLNYLLNFIGLNVLRSAQVIRTVSKIEAKTLIQKLQIAPAKIMTFPMYTDWQKLAITKVKKPLTKRFLGFNYYLFTASRLVKQKNLPQLIHSFQAVLNNKPLGALIICGEGSEEHKLKQIVNHLRLEQNIFFLPWQSNLVDFYQSADLFVLPSNYEGWGRTVVEAVACHCPVVMTDTGCAQELIIDHQTGLVVPINNEEALTKAILEILDRPELKKNLTEKAYQQLTKLPTFADTLKLIQKLWQQGLN